MALVAPSGYPGASNEMNHVSPFASFAVKPGANPALFSRVMVQSSGLGAGLVFGPRTRSSALIFRGMIRLVNQLESGTSSIVFTLIAWTFEALRPGVANRL